MNEDDLRGPTDSESEDHEQRRSTGVWLGILLIVLILIAILFIWWLSQRPLPSPLTADRGSAETPAPDNTVRPDPTVPSVPSPPAELDGPRVPDVVGDRRSAAEDAVRRAGYKVAVSTVSSASKASGIVVAQNPPGGTELDQGATVRIIVTVGSASVESVTMPRVIGLTQASAEAKVKAAGLVPYLIYGDTDIAEGHVISQWPSAGESVPKGSEGFIQIQLNN